MRLRGTNRNFRRVSPRVPFNPRKLFRNSEQGVHYDPSDFSTLFQDSAGTTPVTAVEQPVGLMLDKRLGLVLGPELYSGGNITGVPIGGPAFTNYLLGITAEAGKAYRFSINVSGYAGTNTYSVGGIFGTDWVVATVARTGDGLWTFTLIALRASAISLFTRSTNTANFSNISVRELPGNHAFQTTAIDRPILRNRYNLLTKTEQFDDAAWNKVDVTVTPNAATDPIGGNTADLLTEGTVGNSTTNLEFSAPANTLNRFTVRVRKHAVLDCLRIFIYDPANTSNAVRYWVNLTTGALGSFQLGITGFTLGTASAPVSEGGGWYRVSFTFTATVATLRVGFASATFDAGSTRVSNAAYNIWGASLVPADQASIPYQRVNTATDYDSDPNKFPLYLSANGTNTWMQTNSIDFTATDKVTVFAGVRKLSDASISVPAELSPSSDTNAGVFLLATGTYQTATPGPVWTSRSKGSATSFAVATVSAAPVSNVVSLNLGIAEARNIVRVNGTQLAQSASGQGVGNYGNYPLFLFRRGGTSLPFNGAFYGLLIRGALTSDPDTLKMERWLSLKTGVQL